VAYSPAPLSSGCFLGCPLVGGGVSLSGSLSWGESSSSASSSSGPGDLWGLTNCNGTHTKCSAPLGKTQACPQPHIRIGLGPCHLPVNTFFQRTWGLTVGFCGCQCFSVGVKPGSRQFKTFRVYKALCIWLAGGSTSSPPFNFFDCILRVACSPAL
jgi:hypothetical protein